VRLRPDASPFQERPIARGTIEDVKRGLTVAVDWLIDSGSVVATVRPDLADQIPHAWRRPRAIECFATSTTGGAIALYLGPDITLDIEQPPPVRIHSWVGLKDTNTGSNLIGMDVIFRCNGRVNWNPVAGVGTIVFGSW
jgi:hypothetical protein